MLSFKPVTFEDAAWLRPLLLAAPDRGCEYTFGNICIWAAVSEINVASCFGGAVVHFNRNPNCYLFPVGVSDLHAAISEIMSDCTRRGCCCRFIAASAEDCAEVERLFPGSFSFHETRDFAEYVYSSEDLRLLEGKKFHGKRNHISRFEQENEWEFNKITSQEDIELLTRFNEQWFNQRENADEGLLQEHTAALAALKNCLVLGLDGGYITTEAGVAGFALGEPINAETYCVHIEKALPGLTGAYAIVNREFARAFCTDYKYINREDDAGEEGLRKAKLSYCPVQIKEKYVIHKEN